MQSDTSKMRVDARIVINNAIDVWVRDNRSAIDATCITAELFTGRRKNKRVSMLRDSMRTWLRSDLRVRYFPRANQMENLEVKRVSDLFAVAGEWHTPSLVLLATMTGVDHSGLVKRASPQ